MRTERRHQLQSNELAQHLLELRSFFRKHGTYLFAAVIGVAVIYAVVTYVWNQKRQTLANQWGELNRITGEVADDEQARKSLDSLKTLASETDSRDVAQRALMIRGRLAEMLALRKPTGMDTALLDHARDSFTQLLDRHGDQSMLVAGSALSRLANLEANYFAMDGDMSHRDKARQYWERLTSDARFKGTMFESEARDALSKLDRTFRAVRMVEAPPPATQPATQPVMTPISPESILPPLLPPTGEPVDEGSSPLPPLEPEPEQPGAAATQPATP